MHGKCRCTRRGRTCPPRAHRLLCAGHQRRRCSGPCSACLVNDATCTRCFSPSSASRCAPSAKRMATESPVVTRLPLDRHRCRRGCCRRSMCRHRAASIRSEPVVRTLPRRWLLARIDRFDRQRLVTVTAYTQTGYNTEKVTNEVFERDRGTAAPAGLRIPRGRRDRGAAGRFFRPRQCHPDRDLRHYRRVCTARSPLVPRAASWMCRGHRRRSAPGFSCRATRSPSRR